MTCMAGTPAQSTINLTDVSKTQVSSQNKDLKNLLKKGQWGTEQLSWNSSGQYQLVFLHDQSISV